MQPIDLYVVPPSPPCRAVIIAAKYMKINVNLIYVDLNQGEQRKDWFVKLNPQHCLPTINDNGYILWESRAIMTYFANRYSPGNACYPADPIRRAMIDRMLQFDLNVLYRSLGEFLIPIVREGKQLTGLNPVKGRKVAETLEYLDSVLSTQSPSYVAGSNLTLADFSSFFSLEFAAKLKYDFSRFPHITEWFQRMKHEIEAIDQTMNYTVERSICPSGTDSIDCVDGACGRSNSNDDNNNKDHNEYHRNAKSNSCQLDKLCVETNLHANTDDQPIPYVRRVICREHDGCKVVTNFNMTQANQNLLDLLKNTGGKLYDTPE